VRRNLASGLSGHRKASECAGKDGGKFVAGEGNGIRLHAAGIGGFLNQFGSVRGREAVTAEGRDLEMGNERMHPGNSVVSSGGFAADEKTGDDFITAEGFAGRLALTQSREGCLHDVREQRGTNGAVGRGENAADGTGQPMHGTEPGIRQGKPAEQTREGHVFAGAGVAAVVKGGAQRTRGKGDAVPTEGIGDRIGACADKGFDELGECIQPGAGREGRGQIAGQFRVDDGDAGQHERTAEADLEAVFGRSKDGIAGDFRTGASGGGNGNKRRGGFCKRLAATDDFKMIKNIAAVGEQGGDGLAGIDGAATAKSDDQIATFSHGQGEAVPDGLNFRLASRREDDAINGVFAQEFEQRSGAKRAASGDDQRATAEFGGERSGLADRAWTENDAIGGCKFKTHAGDDIRGRGNPRGHLRVMGGHFFMANWVGLGHSRRCV
jgi:hypothetical protein